MKNITSFKTLIQKVMLMSVIGLSSVFTMAQDAANTSVSTTTTTTSTEEWYTNPLYLVIGGVILIIIIALITRGNGRKN